MNKKLLMLLGIALVAGLGGGTAFAYVRASRAAAKAPHKAAPVDTLAHDVRKAALKDTLRDSLMAAAPDSFQTPAESLRAAAMPAAAAATATATPKAVVKGPLATATAGLTHADSLAAAAAAKALNDSIARVAGSATATRDVAEAVRKARTDALGTVLPEERLAKIFAQMQARDAAKVLDQMDVDDIRAVLSRMGNRQAAAILSALTPARAALITKGVTKPTGDKE